LVTVGAVTGLAELDAPEYVEAVRTGGSRCRLLPYGSVAVTVTVCAAAYRLGRAAGDDQA